MVNKTKSTQINGKIQQKKIYKNIQLKTFFFTGTKHYLHFLSLKTVVLITISEKKSDSYRLQHCNYVLLNFNGTHNQKNEMNC